MVLLQDVDLLITNTRLGIVDGATLMRETRRLRPDLPILHVTHERAEADITPPGVPILNEPFTPDQLLLAIGSLLTSQGARWVWATKIDLRPLRVRRGAGSGRHL